MIQPMNFEQPQANLASLEEQLHITTDYPSASLNVEHLLIAMCVCLVLGWWNLKPVHRRRSTCRLL